MNRVYIVYVDGIPSDDAFSSYEKAERYVEEHNRDFSEYGCEPVIVPYDVI